MSAVAPVAASSFAPEERPQQVQAKESRRTGRHEPIRSSTTRIATRGAGLGITLAAGVATGINYLEPGCWP
jgi:anti-sigma factor RsiW